LSHARHSGLDLISINCIWRFIALPSGTGSISSLAATDGPVHTSDRPAACRPPLGSWRYYGRVGQRELDMAAGRVPPGAWAVGVSGGADSVCLLALLRQRQQQHGDVRLHVVHLDHQLRGAESEHDAAFVAELARQWDLPATIARREQIEPLVAQPPANPSARYRALRLALFAQVVCQQRLDGVVLAHHLDDQAETVLLRLIRGAALPSLRGMPMRSRIGGLLVWRPLLDVPRSRLVQHLRSIGQTWRDDASNRSPRYLRNRVRRLSARSDQLRTSLLELAAAAREARRWFDETTPRLGESFAARDLADVPDPVAREAARAWLLARGAPPDGVSPAALKRLLDMARDAATASRQQFAGGLTVVRRRGTISLAT
jgi:tRNA(Ile)-lysidine synthetase-like protein